MKKTLLLAALVASALALSACNGQKGAAPTTTASETTTTTAAATTSTTPAETVKAGTVKLHMNAKGELTIEDEKKATFKATYDPKINAVSFTGSDKKPVSIALEKGVGIIATDEKKVPTVYVDGKATPLLNKPEALSYKDAAGKEISLKDSLVLKLPSSAEVKATTKATATKKGEETTKTKEQSSAAETPKATNPPVTQPKAINPPATQPKATNPPVVTTPTTAYVAPVTTTTTTEYVPPVTEPAPTEPPATEPPATEPAPTELYNVTGVGNSGMDFLYDSYGGEGGAFAAANSWAENHLADLMEADATSWHAWTVFSCSWSDGQERSCTVNFR